MKLPGHPVRTGQAHRGFPGTQWREGCEQRKYRFNCAPSCLPAPVPTEGGAGRDPAYPALAYGALAGRRKVVVTEIVGSPEVLDILPALSNFSVYPPAKNGHKLAKICLKIVFYSSLYLLIFLSFNILQFLLLGITIAYKLINSILPNIYAYKKVKNQITIFISLGISKMMESPGKFLRKERETKNISLEEISKFTKVKEHYLKAIEEDRYELLPAIPYVKGFLNVYARYLTLNPKDIVLQYENYLKSLIPPQPTELQYQAPPKKKSLRAWFFTLLLP